MPSTTQTVVVAILAVVLIIVLVVALLLYELEVRKNNAATANAAAAAANSSGTTPNGNNGGGGGPGNGGSNAGGVPGNASWVKDDGTLDDYYQAQTPEITFVPGKGFIMPVMEGIISQNSVNTWNPNHVKNFPNGGTLPYNSLSFDIFMEFVSGSPKLYADTWDGEHTWVETYAVPFKSFGIDEYLDYTNNHWSPYFMISDIPQAMSLHWEKDTNDFLTTKITTDRNQPHFENTWYDIHSSASAETTANSEILDSVTDSASVDKSYYVELEFTISLEIEPNNQRTSTQKFKKTYDASTDPDETLPILIENSCFVFNLFCNYHYSYLPTADGPATANPLFAAIVLSNNSFINVTYSRGYGDRVINKVNAKYPITVNNTFCIDYVLKSSSNNPTYLQNTDNHLISLAIPVPYFPKQFDLYLDKQIALEPDIVFDMNAPNP